MSSNETTTYVDVHCFRQTNKAIKVDVGNGICLWVPQSQVHEDSEVYGTGHHGKLVVNSWFAEKVIDPEIKKAMRSPPPPQQSLPGIGPPVVVTSRPARMSVRDLKKVQEEKASTKKPTGERRNRPARRFGR